MQGLIINEELPNSLINLYLDETVFWKKFHKVSRFEDPFCRSYDLCRDLNDNRRVAVKDYCSATSVQRQDVLLNLEAYTAIQKMEEICKLVAFSQQRYTGDIRAAFEYNDESLSELISTHYCQHNRKQFYLFIFKEMLFAIRNLSNIGILLEEVALNNLLFYQAEGCHHLKVLYDQRQKKYDKIQQGIKTYCSSALINRTLQECAQAENNNEEEPIFQLGLMLLDIIYEYQFTSNFNGTKVQSSLQMDSSLVKGYLIFQNNVHCCQDQVLIGLKLKYLEDLKDPFILSLSTLINQMTCLRKSRIKLDSLFLQVERLSLGQQKFINTFMKSKNSFEFISSGKQLSPVKSRGESLRDYDSLKYSDSHLSSGNFKKAIISQTTVVSSNFINTQVDPVTLQFQKKLDFHIIPRQKFDKINCHIELRKKLEIFLIQLQNKVNLSRKEYYDNNTYYGQIDVISQKRNGYGVYIYNHGDFYFGLWKENSLVQGTYIFKNNEGFEGVVKNGKQGRGKYYYSNGNIYEGDWLDDMKNGYGKMYYSNGQSYDGMWIKGKKSGQGTYFYKDGTIFRGYFANGKKQGIGSIHFPDGTKIEAFWQDNEVKGNGKIFYKNGNYFEGSFNFSQKEGKGLYKWDQLIEYKGEFKKDCLQGQGYIKFGDYQFYKGQIKRGKREGMGYYKYVNGDEFKGEWRDDEKYSGNYKFLSGNSFQGRFKDGELLYGVMVYSNGQSYEGEFSNGLRHGKGLYRDSLGNPKYEGRWQDDKFISFT